MKKPKILNLSLFYLFAILLGMFGCGKEDTPAPREGFQIFKTKADYFEKVFVTLKDGKAYYRPDGGFSVSDDSVTFQYRAQLVDGYIIDRHVSDAAAVIDYTAEEYYELMYVKKTGPSIQELQDRIIEKEPFKEYYFYDSNRGSLTVSDTAEINEIIQNGELENYFERIIP